jgi:hypothetical protein
VPQPKELKTRDADKIGESSRRTLLARGEIPALGPFSPLRYRGLFEMSSAVPAQFKGETQMAQRHQRGWLKKEIRSQGETWVLFFRTIRKAEGKRVESKIPVGLIKDFPDKRSAWAEVERLHLQINQVDSRRGAQHYTEHELADRTESIHPKAHTTIKGYERVLRNRLLPRWGNRIALSVEPLEVEQWLKALKREEGLANPTLDKMCRVMSLVYKHGQRYGLIPRNQESNPMRFVRCKTTSGYEAMILTPEQAYAVLLNLREPERTLLLAAGTGLRISECLGAAMAGRELC